MALRGTDSESYITDCTLVYEDTLSHARHMIRTLTSIGQTRGHATQRMSQILPQGFISQNVSLKTSLTHKIVNSIFQLAVADKMTRVPRPAHAPHPH